MARAKATKTEEVVGPKAKKVAKAPKAQKSTEVKDHKQLWNLKKEYFEYKLSVISGTEKNIAKLKQMRKEIAKAILNLNKENN